MPASHFAVVYDDETKVMRRIIHTDNDADNDHLDVARDNLQPGEQILILPISDHPRGDRTAESLQPLVGIPSHAGRCAAVDADGNVVAILMADPALDPPPPGTTLHLSNTAAVGGPLEAPPPAPVVIKPDAPASIIADLKERGIPYTVEGAA